MKGKLRLVHGLIVLCALVAGCSADQPARLETPNAVPAAGNLVGRVLDSKTGQPLANAQVFLVYSANRGNRERLAAKGVSDPTGQYRFDRAVTWPKEPKTRRPESDGPRYYVFAVHPDKGMSFAVVLPNDPLTDVNVRLVENKINTIKVVDEEGKPVAGATVHYSGGGIEEKDAPDWDRYHRYANLRHDVGVLSGVSDDKGEVKLPGLYDGCNYAASKEGYAPNYGGASIPLLPGRKVCGRVTYSDGTPAAGALVDLAYSGPRLSWGDATETDAEGRYAFKSVPASGFYYGFTKKDPNADYKGTLTVSATDPANDRFMSKPVIFEARRDDTADRDIVLEKGVLIGGRVVDDRTGKPLAGIRIEGNRRTQEQNSYQSLPAMTTDTDGRFQTSVPPGSSVSVRWADSSDGSYILDREWMRSLPDGSRYEYEPLRQEQVTADKTDIELKMRLWDVQPMDGVAVDSQGRPAKNASVYLNTHIQPIMADANGKFVLKAAARDRDFDLCVVSADKAEACLMKVAGGTTSQQFQLKPTVTMSGVVKTPSGLPADNLGFYMDLALNGESHYRVRLEPRTDRQGRFSATGLIPGAEYNIFWTTDNATNRDYDHGSAKVDLSAIKDGEPIEFTAKKFVNALMGRIVDDKGNPVANANILIDIGNDLMQQERRMRGNAGMAKVEKDGSFTIPQLADGKLTFKVSAPGFKTMSFTFPTDEVDAQVRLRSAGEPVVYRARVVDPEGKPVAGANVVLAWVQHSRNGKAEKGSRRISADADGVASYTQPAPAEQPQFSQVVMICDMPGYDLAFSPTAQTAEDLDAVLALTRSTSHWKGRVEDSNGKPIEGAAVKLNGYRAAGTNVHVSLTNSDNSDVSSLLGRTTTADGVFELSRLPRDAWVNVSISAPGKKTLYAYFDPGADKADVKPFIMQQGCSINGRVVVKATGELLATQDNGSVIFYQSDGTPSSSVRSGTDGTFSTDDLEPGTYAARFIAFGGSESAKWVTVDPASFDAKPGQASEIVVYVEEGIALKGVVRNLPPGYGTNGREGSVSAHTPDRGTYAAASRIARDGTFTIYLPGAGRYNIKYVLPGANNDYQQKEAGTITVEAGKAVEELTIEHKP